MADPLPRSSEVRIRVEAIGVTFADLMGRMGLFPAATRIPFVPGYEVAGTVEIVGQGVPGLKEGDPVVALTRFLGYSDVVCVPHKQVFKRLDWMTAEQGAAMVVDYLLAYMMLVVMGSLRKGDRVLIHNAGGGVGLAALDICKIVGAETYGTSSPGKHEFLLERGLQYPIDYRNMDYERVIGDLTAGRGMQLILDPLGGFHWQKNFRLLMPTGRLICFGMSTLAPGKHPSLLPRLQAKLNRTRHSPANLMEANKAVAGAGLARLWSQPDLMRGWMAELIDWYDEALFRPHIDRSFPLAQAAAAHHYLHDRQNIGKVLLLP
jgi:synaptic vesicle membrane protein VAT-1